MNLLRKKTWLFLLIAGMVSLTGCGIAHGGQETASVQETLTQDDMQLGKLVIGESLEDLRQEFGEPAETTFVHGNGAPQWEYPDPGFTAGGDPVFLLDIISEDLGSTPRGIHVGSKKDNVEQAYPHAQWQEMPDYTSFFDQSSDRKCALSFFIYEKRRLITPSLYYR